MSLLSIFIQLPKSNSETSSEVLEDTAEHALVEICPVEVHTLISKQVDDELTSVDESEFGFVMSKR